LHQQVNAIEKFDLKERPAEQVLVKTDIP
jgi:hypothetical protein